jgi:hypothetical protein
MNVFRKLMLALPIVAMSAPAMAGNLSGNYLITLQAARPNGLKGEQVCFTLNQTSSVLNWKNSGTWSVGDVTLGYYYVVQGVITMFTQPNANEEIFLSGKIANGVIGDTSFLAVYGDTAVTGTFTAAPGGC